MSEENFKLNKEDKKVVHKLKMTTETQSGKMVNVDTLKKVVLETEGVSEDYKADFIANLDVNLIVGQKQMDSRKLFAFVEAIVPKAEDEQAFFVIKANIRNPKKLPPVSKQGTSIH